MLLEYGVSNYRSFKSFSYIDLHPAKNKIINRYPENFVELSTGEKVLKTSVIVGENAGGKSNFVESLMYLRDLISRTDRYPRSMPNHVNYKNLVRTEKDNKDGRATYDSKQSMSKQEFAVDIALDEATYSYNLEIDANGIALEQLSFRQGKSGKEIRVFSFEMLEDLKCDSCDLQCNQKNEHTLGCRQGKIAYNTEVSDFDESLIKALNESKGDNQPRLTLIRLATLGEPKCKKILDWFIDKLVIALGPNLPALESSIDSFELISILESNKYLDIVKLIDASICELIIDPDRPFKDSIIVRCDLNGKEFREVVRDDSAGVKQFLYWALYVYEVVYRNKTVVADEIDSAMNPVLSDKVLAYINGRDHRGQFIFTTHNIFNLSLRTFMKEQINFVTKDRETLESVLYSLADFDEIRYDVKTELYEFYMKGILGGTVDA